jgi:carbonic anhydrase
MSADGSARSSEFARILAENERYSEQFDRSRLLAPPLGAIAILTCMDARIVPEEALGLRPGDAHVIRNAGGLATEDAIRSLVLSQQVLGTEEVLVIQHTGCGLFGLDDAELRSRMVAKTGRSPGLTFGGFSDLEASVRRQVDTLRRHPWLEPGPVHGLVYDVLTGRLRQVA